MSHEARLGERVASAAPHDAALGREALWGTARIFTADALLLPTGLLTAAYLSRELGPGRYGLYALAAAIVVWLEWSVTALYARATLKLVAEADDWRGVGATITWAHVVTGALVGALVAVCAVPLADLLAAPALAAPLRLFSLDVPIVCAATAHRNLLVGIGRYGTRAAASAARSISRMALAIGLVAAGFGVNGAIAGVVASSAVELLVTRLAVRPRWRRDPAVALSGLAEVALPLLLFAASVRLLDKLDILALQRVGRSVADTGVYAAAQNLAVAPGLFASVLSGLLMAMLGRLRREGRVDHARWLSRGALRVLVLLVPFAAIVAGGAGPIVRVVFGAEFAGAIPLVGFLVFAAMGLLVLGVASAILTAWDHAWDAVIVAVPAVVLGLAGYALAIPPLGARGAAIVTACIALVAALGSLVALRARLRFSVPAATIIRGVAVSVIAFAAARALDGAVVDLTALGGLLLLGAAVPLCFLATGELTRDELALLGTKSS
jgi:O-antigen/teichoic acid export membrane protein